jgi:hypothetical protein
MEYVLEPKDYILKTKDEDEDHPEIPWNGKY